MLKLYTKVNGKYEELSAVALSPHIKPIKKVTVQFAISEYLKKCTSKKCLKNQSNEKLYFGKFAKFLKDHEIEYIDEVTLIHIEDFVSYLSTLMKPVSVNRRMCSIGNFFNKCFDWGLTRQVFKIKKQKIEKNPHRPWSEEVFNDFLKLTKPPHTQLFKLLWATGCRGIEAHNLKWTDIDWDEKKLVFRCGKNANVSREFPISPKLSAILHQIKPEGLHVFMIKKKQVNLDCLYYYTKDRLKHVTKQNLTLYGIRHAFGTRLNREGASGFTILKLMGHSDYRTTQNYIHFENEKLSQWVDKIS